MNLLLVIIIIINHYLYSVIIQKYPVAQNNLLTFSFVSTMSVTNVGDHDFESISVLSKMEKHPFRNKDKT